MQKDHNHSQEQFLFSFLQFSASVGIPEAMVFGSDDDGGWVNKTLW